MRMKVSLQLGLLSLVLLSTKSTAQVQYCPPGKEYTLCGSTCPATCSDSGKVNCPDECVEGCFCPDGLVELGGSCVDPYDCPPDYGTTEPPPYTTPPYQTTEPRYYTTEPRYYTTEPRYYTTEPRKYTTDYPSDTPGYPTPSDTPGYPTPSDTPGYPTPPDPYPTEPPYPPYPSDPYPYDPYEPYDPYDPYPFYYCELNEDEYGRPYYGPYDEYRGPGRPLPYPPSDPPPYPPSYPPPYPPPPSYPPPSYPPPSYPPIYPTVPPTVTYVTQYEQRLQLVARRKKRQTLQLPACITANECNTSPEVCYGSGTQYDSCGRRCTCRNGVLVDCCRVRKEWRSMTQIERCRYVTVVHTASTTQPWKTCYDALIEIHRVQFGAGIHQRPFFLPWHRWYILSLENLLRQIDCNVTVPYWDWSLEPQTWQNSIVWAAQCGLGGDGDPNNNDYVSDGVYRQANWQLTPSAATSNFLRRRFNGVLPDCASVAMIQRSGLAEFNTWHDFVSSNLHDSVHCNIGGTMCTVDSANAPEFFLHHGFIDKIWADWQNKGPGYKNQAYYTQNTNAMPAAYGHSPSTTYDLDNQPGCVRVCIEPSSRPCRVNTTYTPVCPREMGCYEYSPVKLANMIPRPYPYVPQASYDLFQTPYEVQQLSTRFSDLFGNYDDLYEVLQNNGYSVGANSYRPAQGQLQYDRYVYQPVYAPNATAYDPDNPPPPECRPYIQYK